MLAICHDKEAAPSIKCSLHDETLHPSHYFVATQYTILIIPHPPISFSSLQRIVMLSPHKRHLTDHSGVELAIRCAGSVLVV